MERRDRRHNPIEIVVAEALNRLSRLDDAGVIAPGRARISPVRETVDIANVVGEPADADPKPRVAARPERDGRAFLGPRTINTDAPTAGMSRAK